MTKFMFSESEAIYNKNKSNGLVQRELYVPTPKKSKTVLGVVNKKARQVYLNCRKCNHPLEHFASKVLGICPSCDNL